MSDNVDEFLDGWLERTVRRPRRGRGAKRTITHTKVADPSARVSRTTPLSGRQQLALTVRKAPEVMVKISGGGKGMPQIKAHFDYISRNGQVELENEEGQILSGREALHDLHDEWRLGQYGIPEQGRCKEAFNIVLSMPPGTSRAAVKDAARDFAQREFGRNHPYVFAEHSDEKHPHVHLCVKSLGNDGTRLNPRKADLQHWREQFAESLREQGVAANATRRVARGVTRKATRQPVLHMEGRGQRTVALNGRRKAVREELSGGNQAPNPHRPVIEESRRRVVAAYGEAARVLASSPSHDDKQLALEIVEFVRAMPQPLSAREAAVAVYREMQGRQTGVEGTQRIREPAREHSKVKPEEKER